uniref:Uncharacterized protein n=1 Tax=Globodera rostochiensis TaxID=31243 RepID=A0A914HI47_GLORO
MLRPILIAEGDELKFRILGCQWLLCSLLDFAVCTRSRIGREGEANEEKMAMVRELGKILFGLHQIRNQLSALQEGNAPYGGGPTKSNAPRQSETEDN